MTGGTPQQRQGGSRRSAALIGGGRKLVLIGFMGAGKSTAARLLAVRLDSDFVDTDVELEQRLGHADRRLLRARG